jgi:hypothetical protein
MVVEGPVVRVFDPAAEIVWGFVRDVHDREQAPAEGDVADFVLGTDVVDLPWLAAVQDRVEGVGCVAGVEVAACGRAVAVEDDGFVAGEEAREFGDDF